MAFIEKLVGQHPLLQPLLAQHLADNNSGMLPHVFMGDVTRACVVAWREGDRAEAQKLLEFLERGFAGGGREIDNLIYVSFLENLPQRWPRGRDICDDLPPHLAGAFRAMAGS